MTHRMKLLMATVLAGIVAAGVVAYRATLAPAQRTVVIAAGSKTGEAHAFAHAIRRVLKRHHPDLEVSVKVTAGSRENLELLRTGGADLATVQADVAEDTSARLIAEIYADVYQLVGLGDVAPESVTDLTGKTVAVPSQGSGQYVSFGMLLEHYGYQPAAVKLVEMTNGEVLEACTSGTIDAVFRVRAPRSRFLNELVRRCPARLIPISQGAAMRLQQPGLQPGNIPRGTYRGYPPLPEHDLPTVKVPRLLLARPGVSDAVANAVTSALFEHRHELARSTPLAGMVTQPDRSEGTLLPVHPGARAFYDREKPHFLVQNADFLALVVSLLVLLGSGLVGLKSMLENGRKNRADAFNLELMALRRAGAVVGTAEEIVELKKELYEILARVVDELDHDRVTPEGFNFFSFTWHAVYTSLAERQSELEGDQRLSRLIESVRPSALPPMC